VIAAEANELRLSTAALASFIMLGMGPLQVAMGYLPVAPLLTRPQQKEVARRVVLTGVLVVVLVMLVGGFMVRRLAPHVGFVLVGGGLVLVVATIAGSFRKPTPVVTTTGTVDYRAIAITPLAMPGMINHIGVTLLLIQAAYASDFTRLATFVGMAMTMLLIDYLVILFVPRFTKAYVVPVFVVIREIFGLLTVIFGVRMILTGFQTLGLIDLDL
jgi:small neutral amino acid transporter SnatA (MarC family)